MSEPVDRQAITRKDLLWAAGVIFATSMAFIARLTFWGEPGNSLHMKALDGFIGFVWVAAVLVGGAIVPTVASVVRK